MNQVNRCRKVDWWRKLIDKESWLMLIKTWCINKLKYFFSLKKPFVFLFKNLKCLQVSPHQGSIEPKIGMSFNNNQEVFELPNTSNKKTKSKGSFQSISRGDNMAKSVVGQRKIFWNNLRSVKIINKMVCKSVQKINYIWKLDKDNKYVIQSK